MTDADLEPAARRLCEIRGVDPDERVGHGHSVHSTLLVYSPQWMLYVSELRSHMEIEQALMDVLLESTNEYVKGEPNIEDPRK